MSHTSIWFWLAFNAGVFIALVVDLVQFKHRGRELSIRAASQRTAIWILLSLLFNLLVWKIRGPEKALEFLTGYVIEYSLSVDNIFVALVERFDFILYFFGAFLLVSAWRMFFIKQEPKDFGESWVMRCCSWAIPVTPVFHDEHFKARVNGKWMLTPLALALIVIDVMDLVFAVDSIPAVFAITRDPFIIYTSNICAILGLRSLYFLVAKMIDRFVYLKSGLAIVLAFVGAKMMLRDVFEIPTLLSLGFVVGVLGATIVISMIITRRNDTASRDSTP